MHTPRVTLCHFFTLFRDIIFDVHRAYYFTYMLITLITASTKLYTYIFNYAIYYVIQYYLISACILYLIAEPTKIQASGLIYWSHIKHHSEFCVL
jgi:hypothetical protein